MSKMWLRWTNVHMLILHQRSLGVLSIARHAERIVVRLVQTHHGVLFHLFSISCHSPQIQIFQGPISSPICANLSDRKRTSGTCFVLPYSHPMESSLPIYICSYNTLPRFFLLSYSSAQGYPGRFYSSSRRPSFFRADKSHTAISHSINTTYICSISSRSNS